MLSDPPEDTHISNDFPDPIQAQEGDLSLAEELSPESETVDASDLQPLAEELDELLCEANDVADPAQAQEEAEDLSPENKAAEEGIPQPLAEGLDELLLEANLELRLQKGIDLMEKSLSHAKTPQFKVFWDTRKLCMPLFKEAVVNPNLRGILWDRCTDLTKEARRLKEMLDEQTAFAVEQIEMAIAALDADIEAVADYIAKNADFSFEPQAKTLESRYAFYLPLQQELDLLNNYATRINGLRKELIRTEMRVRQKNKFFQRLSLAGDRVFPRRKELIKQVSHNFIQDIEAFVQKYFSAPLQGALAFVRDEIKSLQATAKTLTLNTHSFTKTRTLLSESWEKVKNEERERRKERLKQKGVHRQNASQLQEQINAFTQSFETGELTLENAKKQLDELADTMRKTDVGYDELPALKELLKNTRSLVNEKIREEEETRKQQADERERSRLQKIIELRERVQTLLREADTLDAEQLLAQRDELLELVIEKTVTKAERVELERQLKSLNDLIADKKERALLTLSDDDRQNLDHLRTVLRERMARRDEIKEQLERIRKAGGNAGFDIEQAMAFSQQQHQERERLDRINDGIREIQQKIQELKKKV